MLQMVHPDRVVDEAGLARLPLVEPVYPLTEGLFENQVRRKAIDGALAKLPPLPEWQDAAWLAQRKFPTFAGALRQLHRPSPIRHRPRRPHGHDLPMTNSSPANWRWRWCARIRAGRRETRCGDGRLRKKIVAALPYRLTKSQTQAIAEIAADLAKPERMLRLLQGDVGSGKTVVALLACAAVVEAGARPR